ncbi:MAG TPA: phosphoserine phosphatase SerB [Actinobacteria bacterium]|nr:phosphoserine phosphatase SerB [Actinomycetota bacterium]
MTDRRTVLVHVTGPDRPGITSGLLEILARAQAELLDMEQFVVMGRLTLDVVVALDEDRTVFRDLLFFAWERSLHVEFEDVGAPRSTPGGRRHAVTAIGAELGPAPMGAVASAIAEAGGNIDRIRRLAWGRVVGYELLVTGADDARLRAGLGEAARLTGIDVAVQRADLERRAKRLVVLDVDSTLLRDEVVDLLAAEAGAADEVRSITQAAMEGRLDFEESLRRRVRLLAGLDVSVFDRVLARLRLTPGARRFVGTLRRLGFATAIVSGGFTPVTDVLRERLGFDYAYANELEVVDGRLTGELVGPIVDRRRKAELLEEIAEKEGIPLEQTVAVGDGANDLDMLERAGLGIAFNANAPVVEAADTTVSVPYLDAILFLLGIGADEIETAPG